MIAARIRGLGFLLAPLVALFVWVAPAPARANDIAQCVGGWAKTALDPNAIKQAAEFLANYGQCVPLIADPSGQFAAITSALVAAKKAGQFSSVGQCQGMTPNLLADVAVKVSDSVGDVIGFKIPDAIKSKGKQAIVDWINSVANSNPAVASIKAQMNCGCAVATYGTDQFEKVINQVVDTAEACAGVIGDIAKLGEEVVNEIAENLDKVADDLAGIAGNLVDLMEDCLSASVGQKSVMDCLGELPDLAAALGSLLGSAASAAEDFLDALGAVTSWAKPACCATIGKLWGGACGGCSPPSKPKPPKIDLNCQGVLCAKGMQCGGELNDRCVPCAESLNYAAHGATDGMCACNEGYAPTYKTTAGGPVLTACTCKPPLIVQPILVASICKCPAQGQVVQYKSGNMFCDCKWGESMQGGKCQPIKCPGHMAIAANGKSCAQFEPISLKDQPTPTLTTKPVIPCPPNYHRVDDTCVYSGPYTIPKDGSPLQAQPVIPPCPPDMAWDGSKCVRLPTRLRVPGLLDAKPVPPRCPTGSTWDGKRCAPTTAPPPKGVTTKAVPVVPTCPGNQKWDGTKCASPAAPTRSSKPQTFKAAPVVPPCPPNTRWDGTRCAPAATPPTIKTPSLQPRTVAPACPPNTKWDGRRCAPLVQPPPKVQLLVPPAPLQQPSSRAPAVR
ncbi:MAG: hypothetical protein IT539_13930 [Bradyrhizobiaceae bacterium]|nr:hypothetical protein [Bradyrhizobiaceae bacterium]